MATVEIEQLFYAYPALNPESALTGDASLQVLKGVDLVVERGEFFALMGPTGAGKTTLCLAMNGIVPQSTGGSIRGRVTVLGLDARAVPVAHLATRVGIVFQDAESQLFSATVEEEVAFGLGNLAVPPGEMSARVAWALDVVDMSAHRQRSPAHLSGGQKQRVAIAASLAMQPELLILDEPTAGLDPLGQSEVFVAIERLRRERQVTIVMVSHDADRVAQFAQRVAILHDGRIARVGEPLEVFEDVALMECAGLAPPQVTELSLSLNRRHGTNLHFASLDEAVTRLSEALGGGAPCR
ncbi:MAG: energy-coupling factor ABC transporter ATP-binding protein [Anaerolineae bacterium]